MTWMLTANLFVIAQTWKQSNYLSTGGLINIEWTTLGNTKKWTNMCYDWDESPNNYVEWKKTDTKYYLKYGSIYIRKF